MSLGIASAIFPTIFQCFLYSPVGSFSCVPKCKVFRGETLLFLLLLFKHEKTYLHGYSPPKRKGHHFKNYCVTLSGSLFVHSQEEELVNRCMSPSTAGVTSFKLHDRAKHVYSEAARVLKFKSVCEEKPANAVQVTYYSMVLVTCFPMLGTGCMFSRT